MLQSRCRRLHLWQVLLPVETIHLRLRMLRMFGQIEFLVCGRTTNRHLTQDVGGLILRVVCRAMGVGSGAYQFGITA